MKKMKWAAALLLCLMMLLNVAGAMAAEQATLTYYKDGISKASESGNFTDLAKQLKYSNSNGYTSATITLNQNVMLEEGVSLWLYASESNMIPDITFDFNSYTLSYDDEYDYAFSIGNDRSSPKVTFKGNGGLNAVGAISIRADSHVIIEGGNFTGTGDYLIKVSGGSLDVQGGTLTTEYNVLYLLGGDTVVSGGTITSNRSTPIQLYGSDASLKIKAAATIRGHATHTTTMIDYREGQIDLSESGLNANTGKNYLGTNIYTNGVASDIICPKGLALYSEATRKFLFDNDKIPMQNNLVSLAEACTVIFHSNYDPDAILGEKTIGTSTALTSIAPQDLVRTGYTFKGWTQDPAGNTAAPAYVGGTSASGIIDLYAQWEIQTYIIGNPTEMTNGTVTAKIGDTSVTGATYGQKVTLVPQADDYYEYVDGSLKVTADDGTEIVLTNNTFEMPAQNVTVSAAFEAITYNITVTQPTGGTITANPLSGTNETEVTLTYSAEKGYEFTRWEVKANGGNVDVTDDCFSIPGADVTVSAVFDPIQYKIDYVLGEGGDFQDTGIYSYTVESPAFNLPKPEKEGYTFTGWTGNNGTTPQTDVTIPKGSIGDRSYTANWKVNSYTVKLDANGGQLSGDATFTAKYGDTLTIKDPSRTGYTFGGWVLKGDGKKVDLDSYTMPAGDITLIAQWEGQNVEYNVVHHFEDIVLTKNDGTEYDKDKASESQTATGKAGEETAASSLNPVPEGFTMKGTNPSPEATDHSITQKTIAGDGSTVVNIYYTRNEYQLTVDPDNGTEPKSYTYRYGATIENNILAAPSKAGYDFDGWDQTLTTMPAENTTIKAKWTPRNDTAYIVEIYLQNVDCKTWPDTASHTITGRKGTTDTNASVNSEDKANITGFTFDDDNTQNVLEGTIAGDGSLKLKLYFTRDQYTITLHVADHANNTGADFGVDEDYKQDPKIEGIFTTTYTYGVEKTLAQPTWDKHQFVGWKEPNADKAVKSVTISAGTTGNLAYKAEWKHEAGQVTPTYSAYQVIHYQQNVDGTGYTEHESQMLIGKIGEPVSAEAKTYEGFTLNQDKTVSAADKLEKAYPGDDGKPVMTTLAFYYDRNKVTLELDLDGDGEPDDEIEGVYGEEISEPAAPPKDDYEFIHWADEDGTPVSFPLPMPSEDLTIHPVYVSYPPVIEWPTQTHTVSVVEGEQAILTVKAKYARTYQWYISRDGGASFTPIEGATEATYKTSRTKLSDTGYLCYCVAINNAGSAQSAMIRLQVNKPVALPATGDSSNLLYLALLLAVSAAGVLLCRRRADS